MSFMGTPVPPIYAPLLELLLAAAHATSTDALRGITAKFEELSGQPGYCLALSMALANTELTSVVRQHAAVALKNRLQVAWRAVGSDAIPEEEKNAIRSILLETIFDPSDQLFRMVNHLIGVAARLDSAERWPKLVESLIEGLTRQGEQLRAAAMATPADAGALAGGFVRQFRLVCVLARAIKSFASQPLARRRAAFGPYVPGLFQLLTQFWEPGLMAYQAMLAGQLPASGSAFLFLGAGSPDALLELCRRALKAMINLYFHMDAAAGLDLTRGFVRSLAQVVKSVIRSYTETGDIPDRMLAIITRIGDFISAWQSKQPLDFVVPLGVVDEFEPIVDPAQARSAFLERYAGNDEFEVLSTLAFDICSLMALSKDVDDNPLEQFTVSMLGMIAGVWRNNFYVHRIPEKPVHSRVVNSTQKKERHVGFVRARVAAFWTPERVEYFCSTILIGPLITLRERDRALWADSPVDFFIEDSSQLAQHFVRPAAEHLLQTAIEQFGTLIFPKILQLYHQSSGALPAGADAESSLDAIWCALQLAAISPSSRHEFRFSSLLDSTRLHTLRSSNLLKRRFCLMIPQWIEFGLDAPLRPLMIGELVSQTAPAEDLAVRLYASQALAACIADYDFDFETQLQPYLTPALRHLLGLCLEVSSRSLEALATVLAVLSTLIEAVGAAPASTPVLLEHVDALQELLWGLWSWATGSNGAAPPGSVGGVAGGPAGPVAAPVPADSGPDGGASHGAAIQVAVLAFVGKTVSALSQHRTMLAGLRPGPETAGAGAAGPASGAAVDRPLQVILDFCVRELIPRSILAPAAEQQQQQLLEEGTSLWLTVMEASEQLTEPLGALFALLVPMPTPLERFFEGQHQVESPALVFHDSENAEVAMSILRAYVHFRAPFLVRADSPAGAGLRNALAELLRLYVIQPGLALRALDAATAGGPDGAPLDEAAAAAAAAAAAETASDGSVAARVALVSGVAQVLEALMLSVLLGPHPGVAPALGGGSPPALGQFVAWFSHGDATSPSLLNVLLQSIDISSSEARLFRPILLPLVARLFLEFGTWPTAYRLAGLADTSSPHLASQALVHFITIVQDSWDSLSTPFQFRLLGLFAIRLAQDILLPPGAQSAEVQAMPQLHRLVEELLTMSASSISFMHRAQLESKREAADRRGAVSALSGAGAEDNYANGEDDEEDDDYYHRSAAPTPNAIRQGEIAQSDQLSSQSLRTSLLSCLRVLVAHEAQQRQQSQGASPGDSVYDIILAKLEES